MPAQRCTVSIIPTKPTPLIPTGVLTFDGTTQRARQLAGQVIDHPKESGEDGLADDIQYDPEILQMTAHFTDHPLYYGTGFAGYPGRAADMADSLFALALAKVPFFIIVPDKIFVSMVVEQLSDSRTVETGSDKDLEVRFKHIDIGDLTLVPALVDAQTQALGDANPADIGYLP